MAEENQKNLPHMLLTFDLGDPTDLYVDREETMKVRRSLRPGNVVVVVGLPGSGKTELVLDVGKEMSKTNNVFWIDGSDINTSFKRHFSQAFGREAAASAEIKNISDTVYNKCKDICNVVIFENVKCIASIKEHFPRERKNWKILITSTTRDWYREKCHPKIVTLKAMSEPEAEQMFIKHMDCLMERFGFEGWCDLSNSEQDPLIPVIKNLLGEISRYPLVIKQSSAYIFNKFKCKSYTSSDPWRNIMCQEIKSFVQCYKDKPEEFVKFEFKRNDDMEYGKSIFATILPTIEKLKAEGASSSGDYKKNVTSVAVQVLNMMTYFKPKDIPMSILKSYCDDNCTSATKDEFFSDVVDLLVDHLFIKRSNNFVNMEEPVQIVNRVHLQEEHDGKDIEGILVNALKYLPRYVEESKNHGPDDKAEENMDTRISNITVKHLILVWKYASKYPNICKQFTKDKLVPNLDHNILLHTLVKMLSENSSIADNVTQGGDTVLHIAARRGYDDVVDAVLCYCSDSVSQIIKIKNNDGQTALHVAALNNHPTIIHKILKEDKSCIDDIDNAGNTALHHAVLVGYVEVIKILIKCGANVDIRNKDNKLPIDRTSDDKVKALLKT